MSPKTYRFMFLMPLLVMISSCGPRGKEVAEEKIVPPRPLTALMEQAPEIKYRYKGELYRDPFVTAAAKKYFIGTLKEDEEGEMPVLGALALKGIIKDRMNRLAILATPTGSWFLKNERLYDKKGRRVKGIRGEIGSSFVNLITDDNFVKTFKIRE
jgi:hypothetical protein